MEQWQNEFNLYLKDDFSPTLKRNSCVMAHQRRKQIVNHLLFGARLEQHLMRYVQFKNYDVVTIPELDLKNCLVEPIVNYEVNICTEITENEPYCLCLIIYHFIMKKHI